MLSGCTIFCFQQCVLGYSSNLIHKLCSTDLRLGVKLFRTQSFLAATFVANPAKRVCYTLRVKEFSWRIFMCRYVARRCLFNVRMHGVLLCSVNDFTFDIVVFASSLKYRTRLENQSF